MLFEKHFPKTLKLLGMRAKDLCQLYLKELGLSENEIQSAEDLRYFAGFLRQKLRQEIQVVEVAQWESIHCLLVEMDFSFEVKADKGTVIVNPSIQVLALNEKNPVLDRDKGLYVFVAGGKKGTVTERRLDSFEAELIDLLLEDRKYTPDQLLLMIRESDENASIPSTEDARKRFYSLIEADILRLV
ncbi:hypothetical protein D3C87_189680 [compost metagenome]